MLFTKFLPKMHSPLPYLSLNVTITKNIKEVPQWILVPFQLLMK